MAKSNLLRASTVGTVATLVFAGSLTAAPTSNGVAGGAQASTPPACVGLPPGRHALLERMTVAYGLSCSQELKIEPLLHDEESVTKPLLRYTVLSSEQQHAMMLTIKLAARRQLLPLLTAAQQEGLKRDIASLAATGKDDLGPAKGGDKQGKARGTGRKDRAGREGKKHKEAGPQTPSELIADEGALSKAISAYAALTPAEKNSMLLQVKQAALADQSLPLTQAQRVRLTAEVKELSDHGVQ